MYEGIKVLGGAAAVGDQNVDADIARFYEASRGMAQQPS